MWPVGSMATQVGAFATYPPRAKLALSPARSRSRRATRAHRRKTGWRSGGLGTSDRGPEVAEEQVAGPDQVEAGLRQVEHLEGRRAVEAAEGQAGPSRLGGERLETRVLPPVRLQVVVEHHVRCPATSIALSRQSPSSQSLAR